MKKIYILLVALFLVNGAMAQWFPQNSGTTQGLSSVFFTNENIGYAAGSNGTILKTTDGGIDWISQTSGYLLVLRSIYFCDQNCGYAVGGDAFGGDAFTGGASGAILKTNNGGNSWTTEYSDTLIVLYSVHFINPDTGYVVGWDYSTYDGVMLKTVDGGTNWTRQTSGITDNLSSVFFTDDNAGYAVGVNGTIIKTTDGGINWTNQISGTSLSLVSIFFPNENTGYVVGESGTILKTTNGGVTWSTLSSGTTQFLWSVFFTSVDTGYTVSWYEILKTTNGGITWTTQPSGNSSYLESIFFTNDEIGYAVGRFGKILKTIDGGGYPVGIHNKDQTACSLTVYPNPVIDKITISTTSKCYLTIHNLNGQQLLHQEINESTTIIDVSTLSGGVYFVRLIGERTVQVGKFIKQ